ncbi:P-loop containing nucleoside triphosphate hydrolase protein [Zopfochytrium polystomum]|nr:P-loop containing nucleoside triphosphate hydrolase protein [Zopfochytrium polystomum]
MGASGAGKTSLLQVLAGEAKGGELTGRILVNQEDVGDRIKKISGFVFQDDVILATMTVREAITMSATLRLPKEVSAEEKEARVDKIIKLLGIEKASATIIGDSQTKGVSGGERKRTAMAMEMITEPSVLFLDEPTSGLDTFTAYSVVNTLKNVAATGRTVIATIHQPSSEVFELFDDLVLMADGRIIYAGAAVEAIDYFAQYGYKCPDFTNPADFLFMSVLNNEENFKPDPSVAKPNQTNAARIQELLDAWPRSAACTAYEAQMTKQRRAGGGGGGNAQQQEQHGIQTTSLKRSAGFAVEFRYLAARAWKNAMRNPLIVKARAAQTVFMSLIIGIIYLNIGSDLSAAGSQTRNGMLFFITVNSVMPATMGVLSIFGTEKHVFSREFGAGYYGLIAYFLSKVIVELPFNLIFPWISSTIVYWMVGLQNKAEKYFLFVVFCMLCSCCGFALGIAIASSTSSLETALGLAPLILLPLMLFSGLFINNGGIPAYFDWIKYIRQGGKAAGTLIFLFFIFPRSAKALTCPFFCSRSPMKYAFEGLAKNEYTGLRITCFGSVNASVLDDGSTCITQLGMDDNLPIANCVFVLIALTAGLLVVAFLSLLRIVLMKGKAVVPKPVAAAAA